MTATRLLPQEKKKKKKAIKLHRQIIKQHSIILSLSIPTDKKLRFPSVRCDPLKWCELQVQMGRQLILQLRQHRIPWASEEQHLRDIMIQR